MIKILRQLGVGRLWWRIRQLPQTLSLWNIKARWVKMRHLSSIIRAAPIPAGQGEVEIHMLLHHKRVFEALWALYSFVFLAGQPFRIVIHDDGSLTVADRQLLQKVFPGVSFVGRIESDIALENYFQEQGLHRCANMRRNLIFARKLFDPVFFSKSKWILLMDSDVLFYRKPLEVLQADNLYSCDNGYRYCLDENQMIELLGRPCIERFNPGIMKIQRKEVAFNQVESWLTHPGFWKKDGTGNYYAELTLWAMILTTADATPLPDNYRICAPDPAQFTYGHYCGGGYWASLFYTRGILFLKQRLFS
jgi:hypothetical protein